MKKLKTIKFKKIITAFVAIIICLTFSVSVNAATSSNGSSSSSASSNTDSSDTTDDKSSNEESKTAEENSENADASSDKEKIDYSWSTNTIGNSSLVANEEILLDNGYYQFIAITTRDDDVFYVIIDETKTENNVYFLNEVDTYDINKLLGDDETSGNYDNNEDNTEATEETEETGSAQSPNSSGNSQFYLYLVVGIVILGGIGFVLYKFKFKKKETSNTNEDDDFDFEEEDEINEDDERKDDIEEWY